MALSQRVELSVLWPNFHTVSLLFGGTPFINRDLSNTVCATDMFDQRLCEGNLILLNHSVSNYSWEDMMFKLESRVYHTTTLFQELNKLIIVGGIQNEGGQPKNQFSLNDSVVITINDIKQHSLGAQKVKWDVAPEIFISGHAANVWQGQLFVFGGVQNTILRFFGFAIISVNNGIIQFAMDLNLFLSLITFALHVPRRKHQQIPQKEEKRIDLFRNDILYSCKLPQHVYHDINLINNCKTVSLKLSVIKLVIIKINFKKVFNT